MTVELSGEVAVMAAVLAFSAVLQTSTGFGFALLSAPVLAALLSPQEAVGTIVVTGVVVDVLVLIAQGRFPSPCVRDVFLLGAWSLPGLALGAVLLRVLPGPVLQVLVAVAVLFAVWHRTRSRRSPRDEDADRAEHWYLGAAAGFASGLLSTSTTVGGPPTVLYLTRRPRPPRLTRDTLVALSLFRLPASVAALVVADAWVAPPSLPLLWLAVAVGYLIGRGIFARMDLARYERAVLTVLIIAALAAIVTALT